MWNLAHWAACAEGPRHLNVRAVYCTLLSETCITSLKVSCPHRENRFSLGGSSGQPGGPVRTPYWEPPEQRPLAFCAGVSLIVCSSFQKVTVTYEERFPSLSRNYHTEVVRKAL